MNGRPPLVEASNKFRNDLTEGACFGNPDFLDQPLAVQYVACLGCPVRDLCPVPTPWPREECCRRGHMWGEKYANGTCKVCQQDRNRAPTPPNVTVEAIEAAQAARKAAEAERADICTADASGDRVRFVVSMRRGGFGWEEIIRDLRTDSRWLHALLANSGMLSLAADLAEYRESRRRVPGLRPPGRPRKVREVAP